MKDLKGINVVFCGTFNPPTIAHYRIAKKIIDKFDVKDFIFVPCGDSYDHSNLASGKDRIHMLELLCKRLPHASVSNFETSQVYYEGMEKTLDFFGSYYLLMGADNFMGIPHWSDYPEVCHYHKFIVIKRYDINYDDIFAEHKDLAKYRDNFIFIDDIEEPDISSSKYHLTKDTSLLLPEVNDYIRRNYIY